VSGSAQHWLAALRALPLSRPIKILNVCGGHERSIALAGVRSILPPNIELIPGPGCPVCICPEEDIYEAIQMARFDGVTLVAYGDMLRVPVNAPRREPRSLEQARAAGCDIRAVASPKEAVAIARAQPGKPVVFLAAGFETTSAPAAAMLAEGAPDNLFVLLSGRRTWPIVAQLLDSGDVGFDALVAPGHVATVMGPEEWQFVVDQHQMPAAVAGFSTDSLLAAVYSVVRQFIAKRTFLDNCYTMAVKPGGNVLARAMIDRVFDIVDANWRGIGMVPSSGYGLRSEFQAHDARRRFPAHGDAARKRAGEMPPGCDCAKVVLGRIYPNECRLFGAACTPRHPIGPCMVSDEGACRIWWASGVREGPLARQHASA
jgi:hydrogenase expression/formation protein HypD